MKHVWSICYIFGAELMGWISLKFWKVNTILILKAISLFIIHLYIPIKFEKLINQ